MTRRTRTLVTLAALAIAASLSTATLLFVANPSSIDASYSVLSATTTEASVTLNPDRIYALAHDGEDNAGAASTSTIYLSTASPVTASAAEGSNKIKLLAGRVYYVGPGVTVLYFKTASGSATFSVQYSAKQRW